MLSCSFTIGAFRSPDLLPSFSIVTIALHITITLTMASMSFYTSTIFYIYKSTMIYNTHRYIFTCLSPFARLLYPEADDSQLEFLTEDGTLVEPAYYLPILPMLLVNGSYGIGTGWSSFVPQHDPQVSPSPSLSLRLKGPFLYTVGIVCNVEWCIRLTALVLFYHSP